MHSHARLIPLLFPVCFVFFLPSLTQLVFFLAFLFFFYSLFFSLPVAFRIYVVNVDLCNNQHHIEMLFKVTACRAVACHAFASGSVTTPRRLHPRLVPLLHRCLYFEQPSSSTLSLLPLASRIHFSPHNSRLSLPFSPRTLNSRSSYSALSEILG